MCPSFMATREEAHSTRGRANVLRLAMAAGWARRASTTKASTACSTSASSAARARAECPVGVDVARFKSEFLADYWRRHGTPLKVRAFGRIDELAGWGSRLAPLVNAVSASALGRRLAESMLGIDRRRVPPQWARRTLRHRLNGLAARTPHPRAVLFADTFTTHCEPEIGVAAFEVLDRTGIGASLAPHVCCGRPLISQGLLGEARELAARNVAALYPRAARGQAIVFVEPSCLSAVREDAPDLLGGSLRDKAHVVARQSVLFEEYLEREVADGRASLPLTRGPSSVLLHGHCHQSSMGLGASAAALLGAHPGRDHRRSRRRLLRDGGVVWLQPRSLRRVTGHRRAQAAASRARPAGRRRARRGGHVLPPPGGRISPVCRPRTRQS